MNSQVCVNCNNKSPVNSTNNRLVTESCGHVKCMQCLLREKAGCHACIREKALLDLEKGWEPSKNLAAEIKKEPGPVPELLEKAKCDKAEDLSKKKKPETSHIKLEIDDEGNKSYFCMVCKRKFNSRSQVSYHAYCNGQQKPYHCTEPKCNKSFASQSHFKYHMRVHREERTYPCNLCDQSFFQMSKLQRHKILKHTKEKQYACKECSKAFNNLTSLRKHTLTHTEERPYACPVCERRFRDNSNFRKHVERHDRKWSCGECKPDIGATGAARACAHLTRVFPCGRCALTFHNRKDLRRHAQVHTDSKPYRCKVCNRRFRRKDNLQRHIRNTHTNVANENAVECDENVLKQIHSNGVESNNNPEHIYETKEKKKLEILNPLPPLPQEVIKKHFNAEEIDKSYILEANNARQSVIVAKCADKKNKDNSVNDDGSINDSSTSDDGSAMVSNPVTEYVHKIRKANSMTAHKDSPLPPIDANKLMEFVTIKSNREPFVVEPQMPKNIQIYKNILSGDSGKDKDGEKVASLGPKMYWRRKMQLNSNCSFGTSVRSATLTVANPIARPNSVLRIAANLYTAQNCWNSNNIVQSNKEQCDAKLFLEFCFKFEDINKKSTGGASSSAGSP